MEQDKKEPDRNISLLKHERIEKIEVSVGDEIYSGEWTADSDAFSVSSDSGKIMQVSVCEDTEPDREEITYERYPHLYGPRWILKKKENDLFFGTARKETGLRSLKMCCLAGQWICPGDCCLLFHWPLRALSWKRCFRLFR